LKNLPESNGLSNLSDEDIAVIVDYEYEVCRTFSKLIEIEIATWWIRVDISSSFYDGKIFELFGNKKAF
jgi:hypothetical protein